MILYKLIRLKPVLQTIFFLKNAIHSTQYGRANKRHAVSTKKKETNIKYRKVVTYNL